MIKNGMVYECVDERKGVKPLLNGIAMIFPMPGGFEVRIEDGTGKQFLFEDDDQLEEAGLITTFHMPEGKIHFVELTLADFTRQEGQSAFGTPDFKTTEELHAWFKRDIELH